MLHQLFVSLVLVLFFGSGAAIWSQRPSAPPRSIVVVSKPNASVWLDGVLYGQTSEAGELSIGTVLPGQRSIRVRADGFKETRKVLLPTQKGRIVIDMIKTEDPAELAFQEGERQATQDRGKAVAAYEKALQLRPAYADAQIALARIFLAMGENDKAEKAIAGARKAKPGFAEASVVEGRLLKSIGEEDKAIASFKRAIKEAGGFQPEAYAGLGLLYKERAEEVGASGDLNVEAANYNEAAKNLALAIKQLSGAPDAVVIYQFLGLIYEQQKKAAQAIAVYEEFLKFFPGHPETEAFQSFIDQLKKPQ